MRMGGWVCERKAGENINNLWMLLLLLLAMTLLMLLFSRILGKYSLSVICWTTRFIATRTSIQFSNIKNKDGKYYVCKFNGSENHITRSTIGRSEWNRNTARTFSRAEQRERYIWSVGYFQYWQYWIAWKLAANTHYAHTEKERERGKLNRWK